MGMPPTKYDKAAERVLGRLMGDHLYASPREMPEYSPVDYYFECRRRVVAWAEMKGRTRYELGKLGSAFASVRKWSSLQHTSLAFHIPAHYVWGFQDGAYCVDVHKVHVHSPKVEGRTDRGLANDQEPIVLVSKEDCIQICGPEFMGLVAKELRRDTRG